MLSWNLKRRRIDADGELRQRGSVVVVEKGFRECLDLSDNVISAWVRHWLCGIFLAFFIIAGEIWRL